MDYRLAKELTEFLSNLNSVMEGRKVIRQTVNYTGSQQWQFVSLNEDK